MSDVLSDDEYWERLRQEQERADQYVPPERLTPGKPKMYRNTDTGGSREFDALYPKDEHRMEILRRLRDGSRQTYKTLCDFGQVGGPAVSAGLLTDLRRNEFIERCGKEGAATLYRITDKGRRVVR